VINTTQLPYEQQDYTTLNCILGSGDFPCTENQTIYLWGDNWLNPEEIINLEGLSKTIQTNISIPLTEEGNYSKLVYFNTTTNPEIIGNITYNFEIINNTTPPTFESLTPTLWQINIDTSQLPFNTSWGTDLYFTEQTNITLTCGGFITCDLEEIMINDTTNPFPLNVSIQLPEGLLGMYNDFIYIEKIGETTSNTTKIRFVYNITGQETPEEIRQSEEEFNECLFRKTTEDTSNETWTLKRHRAEYLCWIEVTNKTEIINITEKIYQEVKVAAIDDEATDTVKNTSLGLQNVTDRLEALETNMQEMNAWMVGEEERDNNTFTKFVNWVNSEYKGKINHWWLTGPIIGLAVAGLTILTAGFLKRRREAKL
jgi:hypothetical protein